MAETPIPPKPEEKEASVYLKATEKYIDEGSYEQAILLLKAALMLEPDDTEILIKLAAVYFEIEKYEEARPLLQRALQLNPSEPKALMGLGDVFVFTGKWDAAIELIATLYPLHQTMALELFQHVFSGFNNLLFDRILDISSKYSSQGK